MAVSKFRIYDYWKDKAITKKFEIKPVSACTKEDDALSITEFPDEIFLLGLSDAAVSTGDTSDTQRTLEWRHTFTAVPYFGKVPEWRG